MKNEFNFTYESLRSQYEQALAAGYEFLTCEMYVDKKSNDSLPPKTIINRVDIDLSVKKAKKLGEIFNKLAIKATFFIRLHAPEYNPFSFENYLIIKKLIEDGHEIGYHSEIIDQSVIWDEIPGTSLQRDINVINKMFEIKISGVASHGGITGLNNLDFWQTHAASEFGLKYEAYDFFIDGFYISDSEWTQWKCYNKGELVRNDKRSFGEHLEANHNLIYLLIHSDTYFERHFYE